MKKRLLSILLIGALSLSLCACGKTATEKTEEKPKKQTKTEITEDAVEIATEDAIEQATENAIEPVEETPEPTTAPQPQYTYTDMNKTMYVKKSVNVRTLPSTDGEKIGSLSTNKEVKVTGQCNETGWYRIEFNGATGYVSNNYLSDSKVETPAPKPAAPSTPSNDSGGGNSAGNNTSSETEALYNELVSIYGLHRWNDMGDWFVYLGTSPDDIPGYEVGEEISAILQERYGLYEIEPGIFRGPTNRAGAAGIELLGNRRMYAWIMRVVGPCPQGLKDFVYRYGNEGGIANRYYMRILGND